MSGFGPAQGLGGGGTLGSAVEVSEIESLTAGHIIIGDGSGAPTTRAAFASSTGAFTPGANGIVSTGTIDVDSDSAVLRLGDSQDVILSRKAAAALHLGAADAASPVAQTLGVQGARGGTDTNVAGASLTVRSGIGTGSGAASSVAIQTPTVGGSGTTAQTMATRLTIATTAITATVPVSLPTGSSTACALQLNDADTGLYNSLLGTEQSIDFVCNGTRHAVMRGSAGIEVKSAFRIMWTTGSPGDGSDAGLSRNGAGVVEVNNGTAGTFRDLILRNIEIDGALNHDGSTVGFYGTSPISQQTGVAVTAEGIHAALVALGLITA